MAYDEDSREVDRLEALSILLIPNDRAEAFFMGFFSAILLFVLSWLITPHVPQEWFEVLFP